MSKTVPDHVLPQVLTDPPRRGGVSRRGFLTGLAGATAVLALDSPARAEGPPGDESLPTPIPLPVTWDLDGVSSHNSPGDGDIDGKNRSFPAEELPTGRATVGGLPFDFPDSYADGEPNLLACAGQRIDLDPAPYAAICVIGTAVGGAVDTTVTVSYDDGTTKDAPLQLSDWSHSPEFGEAIAVQGTHRHSNASRSEQARVAMFLQTIPLDPSRTATAITLPKEKRACLVAATAQPAATGAAVRPLAAESTDLFIGTEDAPQQIIRLMLLSVGTKPVTAEQPLTITLAGDGLTAPKDVKVTELAVGGRTTAEIGVALAPEPGTTIRADATAATADVTVKQQVDVMVEATGWTMHMVNHFHYDPVWWNTQAQYTETWQDTDETGPGISLMTKHLTRAKEDPDYRFIVAELDYLKPFWDSRPEERALLHSLIEEGRLEVVGGTYNELSPNLTSAELTIRSLVYGFGYQRDVLGGTPESAWMLDTFGHDVQFPGLCADAGLTSSSWARGPYHGGGPADVHRMEFPTEFDWVSPGGGSLLTHYMSEHYSAGWPMHSADTVEDAEQQTYDVFQQLKVGAATRNCLLPVGSDFTPPNPWVTKIQHEWNQRYVWPKFVAATAKDYFDAVRASLEEDGLALSPQSRDMNPIFTGKDVSFVDTKQAHRDAENTLLAAEKFATFAAMLGARYPHEALDKAWRQLNFNAHHDALTGTGSDQVYLDLVAGWREALDLAQAALDGAQDHLCTFVNTRGDTRGGRAIVAFNPMSWERTDVCFTDLAFEAPGPKGFTLWDGDGKRQDLHIDALTQHEDGTIASVRVGFLATVPATGYATFNLGLKGKRVKGTTWKAAQGSSIENEHYRVEVDAAKGGAISRLLEKKSGTEMLRDGGVANELLAYDEYADTPGDGGNPWVIGQKGGPVATSTSFDAEVRVETGPIGSRIVVTGGFEDCTRTQEITLWHDVARVDCTTRIDGFSASDRLLRVRFQADVAGALPISETAGATIGRNAGFPNTDWADNTWTLDFPAYNWFELGSTLRLRLASGKARAVSVGELVVPGAAFYDDARTVIQALLRRGVTATTSIASASRYGSLDLDSNLPDTRIAVGGPATNTFTKQVLDAADDSYGEELARQLEANGTARVYVPAATPLTEVWVPKADLRDPRALPVLIIAGSDEAADRKAMEMLAGDLEDSADIAIDQPEALDGNTGTVDSYGFAVINRGTPSFTAELNGDLYLNVLRSSTQWPAGSWVDPPVTTLPDGASFQTMHWSQAFHYSLVGHEGDWREGGVVRHGHEVNNPLTARISEPSGGDLPATSALLTAEPASVVVTALKPGGSAMASQAGVDDVAGAVTIRAHETHGEATDATITLFGGLTSPHRVNVLEAGEESLGADGDSVTVPLVGFDIATLSGTPGEVREGGDDPTELAPTREAAQPIYAPYWRHNKGAAPMGYQPVTIGISPELADGDGPFELTVQVASEHTEKTADGTVELVLPEGWSASAPALDYSLSPGEHTSITVGVDPGDAKAGRYLVAARISDVHGEHETVARLDVGAALEDAPELEVAPGQTEVRLLPGQSGTITAELTNTALSEIRGEAQLITPYGVWEQTSPATQGFVVPAGGTETVTFDVSTAGIRTGEWWASVKVMYAGRLRYTAAIPLVVTTNPLVLTAADAAVGPGGGSEVEFELTNIGASELSGDLAVTVPEGWLSNPTSAPFGPLGEGETVSVPVVLEAPSDAEPGSATVRATATAGDVTASTSVTVRVVPLTIEFAPNTSDEKYWLWVQGASISQDKLRFADQTAYWIYRFQLPSETTAAAVTLTMDNQFLVEASDDSDEWTEVLREEENVTDASNSGDFEVDLTPYLGDNTTIYLRFGDSFPDDGWGGRLFNLALERTE